jgi:hypothetical protein
MSINVNVTVQDNGCTRHAAAAMIAVFDAVAGLLFPGCSVDHFYYGDVLDFADIRLPGFGYGHFSITSARVGLGGYAAMPGAVDTFGSMTQGDSCFPEGHLLQIAADAGLHLYIVYGAAGDPAGVVCAPDVADAMTAAAARYPDYDGVRALGRVSADVVKAAGEVIA